MILGCKILFHDVKNLNFWLIINAFLLDLKDQFVNFILKFRYNCEVYDIIKELSDFSRNLH